MKKYAALVTGLVGALLLAPGLAMLFQAGGVLSGLPVLLIIITLPAMLFGAAGALLSVGKRETASKLFAVATIFAVILVAINLYLLISAEGTMLRYTTMGLLFLAISTWLTGKKN